MKTRFYYTLNEITGISDRTINYGDTKIGVYAFASYLLQYDNPIATDNDISKELMKHIWLNLSERNVIYIDRRHWAFEHIDRPEMNDFTEEDAEKIYDFAQSMLSIYEDTKQYYETLIPLYESEKSKLMNDIQSQTRFNDTPQNAQVLDGYAADNYSTNVTTTKTELTTKMNRLNEVQTMLRNLYGDWAFEFNKLVLDDVEEN